MPKGTKTTQESFIEQANKIHNFKFDYSLTKFINSSTKIIVICPIHGQFEQQAQRHLISKTGCTFCGGLEKSTTEKFIKEAKEKYGEDKFTYKNTIYKGSKEKICITCIKHGDFEVFPYNFLKRNGEGCYKCSKPFKKDTEYYINQAKERHGEKYSYEKSIYTGSNKKLIITCLIHGDFEMIAKTHLLSNGECRKCYIEKLTISQKDFLDRVTSLYKEYDFSNTIYIKANKQITINCYKHGNFKMIAGLLLRDRKINHACKKCRQEFTIEKEGLAFLENARKIHGDKYIYDFVEYKNNRAKIKIFCKIHNEIFEQSPIIHTVAKSGCPKCGKNVSKMEVDWLNQLGLPNNKKYRSVRKRISGRVFHFDGFDQETNTVYEFYGDYWHGNPKVYNPNDICEANKKTFKELYDKTIEKENFLKEAGYKLITIWECDFLGKSKNQSELSKSSNSSEISSSKSF